MAVLALWRKRVRVGNNMLIQTRLRQVAAFMITVGLLLVLAGCAMVGPDYLPPEMPLPDQWHSLEALSRVREARAQRLGRRADLFPTVDATGSVRKTYGGDEIGSGETTTLYAAGFDAGWELDLFGRGRRAVAASQADLDAQIEDLNDVLVTLLAEVAVNYIDLRTYQARLAVARSNVISPQETWKLLEALSLAGSGDALAVAQARYNLESSRAKIPDLEAGLEAAMNRLAAQTARIGEAEADLYPKFTLSGSIGLEALYLGDLVAAGSRSWSFGPSFSWPLFDAGAIRSNIRVQDQLAESQGSVLSDLVRLYKALGRLAIV
jgi:outer membrane protein, multidrug efflux system